ncbi:hypothetical protein [Cohnella soli]|uniref:Lipoprotein n=1 Tax=Cohnella soli TaxID=425005 RepID=A0ABW0I365_9BACL
MRKVLSLALVSTLSVGLWGCSAKSSEVQAGQGVQQTVQQSEVPEVNTVASDEKDVKSLIEEFGKKLRMVSLLAPSEIVRKNMQEQYGDFLSPDLLAKWQKDPKNALGKMVSSPWPDRIEVASVEQLTEDTYQIKGDIVEITSAEEKNGGTFTKQGVAFEVRKSGNQWLIDTATIGAEEEISSIVYENTRYGFRFTLPNSWQGYTIVSNQWEGLSLGDSTGEKVVATGPILSIRHPEWTKKNPRRDIPIMIFTLAQWNSLQQEDFHIGAAPVGPNELGRSSKYVYALPARYNFAFPTGYEEVEKIVAGAPLQPIDSSGSNE